MPPPLLALLGLFLLVPSAHAGNAPPGAELTSPPGELDRHFRVEEERWRKVIQDAGLKAE